MSAQQKTISGNITDSNGSPLPGVNVVQKGTTNGVSADFDGNYSITLEQGGDVLIFSSIGFATQEVIIENRDQLNITLVEDSAKLDEVVVIGYGTQRRKDVTGAISSLNADNFDDGAPIAPEQLIQGKIAGVNIVQNSGQPGAASTVRIRGASSISAGNEPLYVVDGVPLQFGSANNFVAVGSAGGSTPLSTEASNPLNVINPADIESIDILKDASATAIYGSRGANGVIVITTKNKNTLGEIVTYDFFTGMAFVPNELPVLKADEYRNYSSQNNLQFPDQGANTNWQNEVFRTAFSQNHNISFAGGGQNSKFRASFGYSDQEGVLLSSALKKYTARINGTHSALNDKLKIGVNLTYSKIDDDKTPISSSIGNEGGNILKDAIRWAPTLPVRNEDGSYYQLGELRINPVSWVDVEDESKTSLFLGNANVSYELIDGLKANLNVGYTNERVDRYTNVPDTHPAGENEGGRASIGKFQNFNTLAETNLTYDKQISDDSYLSVLAGYSFQRFENENTFTAANQFISSATKWDLIQSGNLLTSTSFREANRLASLYGRVNYRLKERYLFTVTLRRDGSSRFGENNRWGLFPSGAFAWNISDEKFLEESAISNLKLRMGYGITGNQEIPNNLYREQLTIDGSAVYIFGGEAIPSVLPSNFPNPDLKWEETGQLNIGVDFGLFAQRFSGSIDYYEKKTTDLLLQFTTAAPSVVESQWANVGEVENNGLEILLNGILVDRDNFGWDASVNFTKNKNEVIGLSNENFSRDEIRTSSGSGVVSNQGNTQIIKPGLPLGTFFGRKFTGFDENGLETYLDVDGEEGADEVVIGNAQPDFVYGFNTNFRFKNFDAAINLRGVVGNDIYNNTAAEFSYPNATPGINVLRSAINSQASRDQVAEFSSRWIEDGSYLRLDNVSVGYNFDIVGESFLQKARMYITGKNLFVITDYSGYDPEVRTRAEGIDYLAYPRPTTIMIGASISFK